MKKYLVALIAAATLLTVNSAALADTWVSLAISGTTTPTITIPPKSLKAGEWIVITNFVDGTTASTSSISVTIGGVTTSVINAVPLATEETFKDLVIAGPATVTVHVGSTQTCFLTYRMLP